MISFSVGEVAEMALDTAVVLHMKVIDEASFGNESNCKDCNLSSDDLLP